MSIPAFWRHLEHRHVKPFLRRLKPWRRVSLGGVRVQFVDHLDGGGREFGQDYISRFRDWDMPRQARAFEWCAGPGFIGFSLLGHKVCETLCLADINPEAVAACRGTARDNGLDAQVTIYRSDNLADIPDAEQWNLVVGNPPHFVDTSQGQIRYHDPEWSVHRGFFAAVGRHLKPGGVIVLQENNCGSTAEEFRQMIEASGLQIVFVDRCAPQRSAESHIYYLGVMRRGDTPPAWVESAVAQARQLQLAR